MNVATHVHILRRQSYRKIWTYGYIEIDQQQIPATESGNLSGNESGNGKLPDYPQIAGFLPLYAQIVLRSLKSPAKQNCLADTKKPKTLDFPTSAC
ncbi:MAG: hypothetical protein AAB686_02730 [Patescibacteria group bacterium]